MTRTFIIALGAALGANARYWIGEWAIARWGWDFPYGTLAVNLVGSFLLGLVVALALSSLEGNIGISPHLRIFLAVGFLGSYTTFSSFSVDTLLLLEKGQIATALLNVFANNILGLFLAFVGFRLGQ